jgi:hypothetical protein
MNFSFQNIEKLLRLTKRAHRPHFVGRCEIARRGCRPEGYNAFCKVSRHNDNGSCQSTPLVTQTVSFFVTLEKYL